MTVIGDLAKRVGFKGTQAHRVAEPSSIRSLPPVDNRMPGKGNVTTSVDCYITGQYIQKGGKVTEVQQRYTIFVAYNQETYKATMDQLRARIMQDFQSRYGTTFNISTVYIPTLPVPQAQLPQGAKPLQMYQGSSLFRQMTRTERARYEIGTQKQQSRLNIQSIRKRYKL